MLLPETSNYLIDFLNDMKCFEKVLNTVREENMLSMRGELGPGLRYILKTHINLNESDYEYVNKFLNILKENNIRKSLIRCLVCYWMVELDNMRSKSVYSGRVRLHGHMIGQL